MKDLRANLPHYWDNVSGGIRKNRHLTAVILIGFFSFVIFYILFNQMTGDNYLREIVSALIATILTVTITTFLLKSQSESEEAKERNVELLRRKIDAYSLFVDCYLESMDEDGMNEEDAKNIRKQIYHLSLFSSSKTVKDAAQLVRGTLLGDVGQLDLGEVIQNFRDELHLDISDDPLGDELIAVDMLLSVGFDKLDQFKETMRSCERASELLQELLLDKGFDLKLEPCYGEYNSNNFTLKNKLGIIYEINLYYPTEPDSKSLPLMLSVNLGEDGVAVPISIAKEIETYAVERGYEWPEFEDLSVPNFETLVDEYYLCRFLDEVPRRKAKGGVTLDQSKLIDIVASEIVAFESEFQNGGRFVGKGE